MPVIRKIKNFVVILFLLVCCFGLNGCGILHASVEQPAPKIKCTGIVKTAYSQIGKKYVSGGASPKKGFDCSGLVWWSFKQHGINVPRITLDQAKSGKKIAKKAIQPGDIVVFRSGNSPRGLHTGIYAGKDYFIHSPSKGKNVCMEKLSSPHWKNKLIAIRRVVK